MVTSRRTIRRRITILVVSVIILLLFIIVPIFFAQYIYERVFSARVDHRTKVIEMQMDDFDDMIREPYRFKSDSGQTLTGYEYTSKQDMEYKALVVLSHGMGCGQIDYLFDINYLVNSGYKVFAYDNTGCNDSEGEDLVGLKQSSIDLDYALDFIEREKDFDGLPVMLYGHSWGGYAVTSVLTKNHDITAVTARSGFNESQDMLLEQGRFIIGDAIDLISPYIYIYEKIKFKKDAPTSAINGIENVDIPILLMHSKDDDVISYENSLLTKSKQCKDRSNITSVSFEFKGHDIVRSDDAIAHIRECKAKYDTMLEDYDSIEDVPTDISAEYFSSVDIPLSNELDEGVMQLIVDFFDRAL